MISTRQPARAPKLRMLPGSRRSWPRRFWDTEDLFELKLTLLVSVLLMGAWLGG